LYPHGYSPEYVPLFLNLGPTTKKAAEGLSAAFEKIKVLLTHFSAAQGRIQRIACTGMATTGLAKNRHIKIVIG